MREQVIWSLYNECLKWVTYFINICSLFRQELVLDLKKAKASTGAAGFKGKQIADVVKCVEKVVKVRQLKSVSSQCTHTHTHTQTSLSFFMRRLVRTSVALGKTCQSLMWTACELQGLNWSLGQWSRFETPLGSLCCAFGEETWFIRCFSPPLLGGC